MNRLTPTDLLLVARDRLWRVDLAREGEDGVTATSHSVGALGALFNGEKRRSVLVLLGDTCCQTLDLPDAQLQGLSEREKGNVLALEAETFTGVSPNEAAYAWSIAAPHDGLSPCTVMMVSHSEVESVVERFREAGLTLAGISHPLFLADPVMGVVSGVSAAEVAQLRERYRLHPAVPTVPLPASEPSPYRIYLAALLLALVAGGACWWFDGQQRRTFRRLTAEERELAALQQRQTTAGQRLKAIEGELAAAEADRAARQTREAHRRSAREAMAFLFKTLSEQCPKTILLRRLDPDGPFGLMVQGLSVSREATDAFLVACGKALAERKWRIQPEEVVAQRQAKDGGPWRFVFRILPPFAGEGQETPREEVSR